MAILSMTGFGRGAAAVGSRRVDVELSSVNRKQFDLTLALPRELATLEARASALVRQRIVRGHVRGSVRLHGLPEAAAVMQPELAREQIEALRKMADALGLADDLSASALLRLPWPVFQSESDPGDGELLWQALAGALEQALDELLAMRQREGAALVADLAGRLQRLEEMVPPLQARAPLVVEDYRATLLKRLQEIPLPFAADDPALLRELALFADRCDISEELTRLGSHFTQVRELLAADGPCGRALDFLCQELFREINTIGSKANDAALARIVIGFKAELEAFREQVQNIE